MRAHLKVGLPEHVTGARICFADGWEMHSDSEEFPEAPAQPYTTIVAELILHPGMGTPYLAIL